MQPSNKTVNAEKNPEIRVAPPPKKKQIQPLKFVNWGPNPGMIKKGKRDYTKSTEIFHGSF